MRIEKLLGEQIVELIDNSVHRFLGAIQDGRVMLGGSAGSAGGIGDPPAGFWGQLRQGNVTYDTAGSFRACSTGSAGSDSLVDNLDAIRLGWEICNDAIGDRHINWGTGAGQVSAVDVPFQTTSGSISATNVRDAIEETYAECHNGGGSGGSGAPTDAQYVVMAANPTLTQERIATAGVGIDIADGGPGGNVTFTLDDHDHSASSGQGGSALNPGTISSRTFLVGPECPYDTVGEAVVAVNAYGPSAGSQCTIMGMAITTEETGDVELPNYCHFIGQGPDATIIGMGENTFRHGSHCSIQNCTITISDPTDNVSIVDKTDWHWWNVRVTAGSSASNITVTGASSGWFRHTVLSRTDSGRGFNFGGTAEVYLVDCEANDETNFTEGFYLTDTALAHTWGGTFIAASDDVYITSSGSWHHLDTNFRQSNSTISGTHIAKPTKRFNQWLIVAEEGGDFQTVPDAVAWINAQGDAADGKRYGILITAGNHNLTADLTIPAYAGLFGQGWQTVLDLDSNTINLSFKSSLESLYITSSSANETVECTTNTGGPQHIRDCYIINSGSGAALRVHEINSTVYAHDCTFDGSSAGVIISGATYESSVYLINCRINGTTDGLSVTVASSVATEFCTITGGANDVNLAAGTWYPHLDSVDWGNCTLTGTVSTKYTAEIKQGDGADIYPMADGGGIFQRNVDHWFSPTDHFNAFSGWTWASYAPFDGAPSTVDVTTYPSLLNLVNNDITEDHFCYVSYGGGAGWVQARLAKGRYSYVGVRLQNGDNDNDDFVELKLIDGTTAGLVAIQRSYQSGGAGITNTTLVDDIPPMFYVIRIYTSGANHSCWYVIDTPLGPQIASAVVIGWTPARSGIVFGQRTSTANVYGATVDWFETD